MSKKIQFWVFFGFYILNLIAIVLIIWLLKPNPDVNIVLSIYLLILTGFFSYATSHHKKK